MKYLPSLSEALKWCGEAGVNKAWGGVDLSVDRFESHALSAHMKTAGLESVNKIVVHRSGFTCGNAPLFRWYHRVLNGWNDIGYHLVIGNGRQGYSVAGALECGRPLNFVGAHCKGNNDASFSVCLIDNTDHFRTVSPSAIELHALENSLLYLLDKAGGNCEIVSHCDLASVNCPGRAVLVSNISQKIHRRKRLIRHKESTVKSLDLRKLFKNGTLNFKDPEKEIEKLGQLGFTRIIYPYHWCRKPWEDLYLACKWVAAAHANNMDVILYTGPFGTELRSFLAQHPESSGWLQRQADGSEATYDSTGALLMFCPLSPYFYEYRLPKILNFFSATGCDGVFFDIPWIADSACFCGNCMEERYENENALLQPRERIVRKGLSEAVVALRQELPDIWLAANVSAPCIWDTGKTGATPLSLSGLFDELVVEWTPGHDSQIDSIRRSIVKTRIEAPASRISHAWAPQKGPEFQDLVTENAGKCGIGTWIVDSF